MGDAAERCWMTFSVTVFDCNLVALTNANCVVYLVSLRHAYNIQPVQCFGVVGLGAPQDMVRWIHEYHRRVYIWMLYALIRFQWLCVFVYIKSVNWMVRIVNGSMVRGGIRIYSSLGVSMRQEEGMSFAESFRKPLPFNWTRWPLQLYGHYGWPSCVRETVTTRSRSDLADIVAI